MRVDMSRVNSVLIVKLSAIGDVVHALPVSAALKKSFPHIEISWVVETKCADVVRGNPYLSSCIEFPRHQWSFNSPRSWKGAVTFLKSIRKDFDLAIDLQGLARSAVITRLSGSKQAVGYHWQREGARFLVKSIEPNPNSVHIVDQYLDVAKVLGADISDVEFPLWIPEEDKRFAANLLANNGICSSDKLILINPSAGKDFKRWPTQKFAELINNLEFESSCKVALVGGSADKKFAAEIDFYRGRLSTSLIGQTTIKQLAALLSLSSLHICGDTGSGHIASALNVRCVSLFGPTRAERSCPYGQLQYSIFHNRECKVCPTYKCIKKECINWITVDEVFQLVSQVLEDTPSSVIKDRSHVSA